MAIRALIADLGGVLTTPTTPMVRAFTVFQDEVGISFEQFGRAVHGATEELGEHPFHELEKGRISERRFFDLIESQLEAQTGVRPDFRRFREIYFDVLEPNEPMIDLMRELRGSGLRMALLTNNVREWEAHWRSMFPVDEVFELVVDSASVGMLKPDPEIYELTVERLGDGLRAERCLFVDDVDANCEAARLLGMTVVQYREPEQAISEIRQAIAGPSSD